MSRSWNQDFVCRGAEFAAGCVTVSTLLSMAAIPLWCEILRML